VHLLGRRISEPLNQFQLYSRTLGKPFYRSLSVCFLISGDSVSSVRIPEPHEIDLVLYHAGCTDGFTAAWAAWEVLGDKAEYIHVQYGSDPPDVEGRKVAIVDFSYPREQLQEMASKAEALVVLDHHKTAEAQLHGLDYARFDMDKSGAVLSWEFFHPGKTVPPGVLYVQDRDLWQWEMADSKEFSAGTLRFYHEDEFQTLVALYGSMKHLLSTGGASC